MREFLHVSWRTPDSWGSQHRAGSHPTPHSPRWTPRPPDSHNPTAQHDMLGFEHKSTSFYSVLSLNTKFVQFKLILKLRPAHKKKLFSRTQRPLSACECRTIWTMNSKFRIFQIFFFHLHLASSINTIQKSQDNVTYLRASFNFFFFSPILYLGSYKTSWVESLWRNLFFLTAGNKNSHFNYFYQSTEVFNPLRWMVKRRRGRAGSSIWILHPRTLLGRSSEPFRTGIYLH